MTKNKILSKCHKNIRRRKFKSSIEPKKIGYNLLIRNINKVITNSFHIKIQGICFIIINEALKELIYISFYSLNIKYNLVLCIY